MAAPLIPALEGLDRGWYAGPVGWTDRAEDGEFCVALRCALLRGAEARLYAGVGVVRDSDPAAELAGLLHPTPAVGGEPFRVASPLIPALEGLDRGWYAGPVGWTDASEDGEFCVALRSALLDGSRARCFAGVGVVADSDPAAELAETEVKLQALLPVLSG